MNSGNEAPARIRDAAARLLLGADLDDLTAFVTAVRLAGEAGVAPSTLRALYPPEGNGRGGVRNSAQAAVRRVLTEPASDRRIVQAALERLLSSTIEAARASGRPPGMDEVFAGLAQLVVECASGSLAFSFSEQFLAAVVSTGDEEVRVRNALGLDTYLTTYSVMVERLCDLTGREPVEGVGPSNLALAVILAFDGAVMNLRLTPELGAAPVRHLFVAIWTGLTRRRGDVDDLLEHRVADPSDDPLSEDELDRLSAAIRRLHDRVGWGGVNLRKVGQLSGLRSGRLAQVMPDRDHLAGIAWADVCLDVTRDCPPGTPVAEVALILVEAACSHRALVGSVLRAGLGADGPPGWWTVPGRGEGPLIDALTSAAGGPAPEVAAVVVDAVLLGAAHDAAAPVLEQVVANLLGADLRRSDAQ
ncbi:MAG: hypothetical protein ACOYOP_16490 [Microthrixaceae bacterium]